MTGRSRARDRSRPSGGALWLPTKLPNLAAWYRGDMGITLNGGTVSAWADQSGNGRHLTQGTAAQQPTYVAASASYNQRPALTFDGGDWLDAASAIGGTTGTVYLVGQDGNVDAYFVSNVGTPEAGNLISYVGNEGIFSGTALTIGSGSTSPSIFCGVFNGANSFVARSNVTGATGNAGTNAMSSPFRYGAYRTGIYALTGAIAEVIWYSAVHDAATRAVVLRYLSNRYAITVTGL